MSNGVRIEHEPEMFPEGTVLRPLRDQIFVRPLDWQPSKIILIAGNKRKPLRGEVVFVGPGQRVKKYWRNHHGHLTKVGETGQVIPTEVKPGDIVELGGLEIDGYAFKQVTIGHQVLVLCQEQDVTGIVTEEPA